MQFSTWCVPSEGHVLNSKSRGNQTEQYRVVELTTNERDIDCHLVGHGTDMFKEKHPGECGPRPKDHGTQDKYHSAVWVREL